MKIKNLKKVSVFFVLSIFIIITLLFFHLKNQKIKKSIYCSNVKKIVAISFYNSAITDREFQKKLVFLKQQKFSPILLNDFYELKINKKKLPQNPVLIILKDGDKSWYETAFPNFKKLNFKANFFLTTNFANGLLTWKMVKKLINFKNSQGENLFEIGSHSVTHDDKTFHDEELLLDAEAKLNFKQKALYELFYSKKIIEENTDSRIFYFSVPFGGLGGLSEKAIILRSVANDVGYKGILSSSSFIVPGKYKINVIVVSGQLPYGKFVREIRKFKEKICL